MIHVQHEIQGLKALHGCHSSLACSEYARHQHVSSVTMVCQAVLYLPPPSNHRSSVGPSHPRHPWLVQVQGAYPAHCCMGQYCGLGRQDSGCCWDRCQCNTGHTAVATGGRPGGCVPGMRICFQARHACSTQLCLIQLYIEHSCAGTQLYIRCAVRGHAALPYSDATAICMYAPVHSASSVPLLMTSRTARSSTLQ